MRLGTAIELLVDNYIYAKSKVWIRDEVAWALYQTWKEADRKTDLQTETKTETQNSNLTFEKADERCKGCGHYKLTCDLFSEICRYEPKDEPQTERELEQARDALKRMAVEKMATLADRLEQTERSE